ncbi:hypothetical protein SEVIR_4G055401v4 [Setaria viridis]
MGWPDGCSNWHQCQCLLLRSARETENGQETFKGTFVACTNLASGLTMHRRGGHLYNGSADQISPGAAGGLAKHGRHAPRARHLCRRRPDACEALVIRAGEPMSTGGVLGGSGAQETGGEKEKNESHGVDFN